MTDTEQILRAAIEQARQIATEKPTAKNRKVLREAQKQLEDHLKQRAQVEPVCENIPALVEFLEREGFKASTSTAYEHRDHGKLTLRDDGTIPQADAIAYARKYLKLKTGMAIDADNNLQQEKLQKDITRIDYDGRMRELKYRQLLGELIERSQVEIELSERTTNLKNYLDTVARREIGKICKILGGDPAKIPQAKAFMLEVNKRAFDNYSRPIKGVEDEE